MLPYLTGEVDESPQHFFIYHRESEIYAIRVNNWKVHFQIKDDWFEGQPISPPMPKVVNLRVEPFEQTLNAPGYPIYAGEKLRAIQPAAAILKMFVGAFDDVPPRQPAPGFNPSAVLAKVYRAAVERQGN